MTTTTMRAPLTLSAIALALLAPGCSILIDSGQYVGTGTTDGGTGDGSTPTDGEVPIDGELPNRPPVLSTLGLDRYEPIVGEVLRGVAGPVIDPDGDRTSVRFEWLRNGTAIPGMTTNTLDTASLTAGDTLALEAWANDGEVDGPRVRVGPVTLLADTTRWRQLLPDSFGDELPVVFYDAPNRRYVRVTRGTVWEYRIDGPNVRVARLVPGGTPPMLEESDVVVALHDEAAQRIFVFGGNLADAYVLDLSDRGAETWSRTTIGGTTPDWRVAPAYAFDPSGPRVWIYGGLDDGAAEEVKRDLWSLELTGDTWVQHTTTGTTPPPLFGASMAMLPGNTELLIYGGTDFMSGVSTSTFRLSLGEADVEVAPGPMAPGGALFASARGTSTGAVFAGGATMFGPVASPGPILLFDASAGSFTMGVSPAVAGALGQLVPDPDDAARYLWWPGGLFPAAGTSGLVVLALAPSDGTTSMLATEARPGQLEQASVQQVDASSFVLSGGRYRSMDERTSGLWRFDAASGLWSGVTPMPDAVTGRSPPPTWGTVVGAVGDFNTVTLAGGEDVSGLVAFDVFQIDRSSMRWVERTIRPSSMRPTPRTGHMVIGGASCGIDQMYVFGGRDSVGPMNDAWTLLCEDRMRDCFWEPLGTMGTIPTARSFGTFAGDGTVAVLFGGQTAFGGVTNELFVVQPCSGSTSWAIPTVSGAAASPRMGHTMTYYAGVGGGLSGFYVIGGAELEYERTTYRDDVYRLEILSPANLRWEALAPEGTGPWPRVHHAAAWDAGRSRVLVYGGYDTSESRGDMWELRVR